jgi:hypothetical protein
MNFDREHVKKALACAALLPPPGDEEVKKFAEDWLALNSKLAEFQSWIAGQVESAKARTYPHTIEHTIETRTVCSVLEQVQKAFEEAG